MAYPTFQIVRRAADSGQHTILDLVKSAKPMAALKKWRDQQDDPSAYTPVDGAGYLQAEGAVILAVREGALD